jgi:hypothetical protein
MRLPPLVTTGASADTVFTTDVPNFLNLTGNAFLLQLPGSLGQANTTVLVGGGSPEEDLRSGGRFTAGYWLDREHTLGIEVNGFFLEPTSTNFAVSSKGTPVLARPFLDTVSGVENALPVVNPPQTLPAVQIITATNTPPSALNIPGSSGSITVASSSRFWGAEADARAKLFDNPRYRIDVLGGFRYLELKEDLTIDSTSNTQSPLFTNTFVNTEGNPLTAGAITFIGPNVPAASTRVLDSFATRNYFYGGQIGAQAEFQRGCCFLDIRGKLAVGVTHQVLDILGSTATTVGGTTVVVPGGLLAVASNSGHFSRDEFGLVPEFGINLGCQVSSHLRATLGYSIVYMRDNVLRPGDQIDLTVNSNQVPAFGPSNVSFVNSPVPAGEQRPALFFRQADFWAQGINAGLEITF